MSSVLAVVTQSFGGRDTERATVPLPRLGRGEASTDDGLDRSHNPRLRTTTQPTQGKLCLGGYQAATERRPTLIASVQLTVFVHTGLVVFSRSLSYGVWPPRPPCGRL
jgi:hypothetical protein